MITKLYDTPVICYGLRTTFKGEFFVGSKPLMELSDVLEELVTICSCGHKAKFNVRKINGNYLESNNIKYRMKLPKIGKSFNN